jgi:uncharacterized membrane protein
MMNHDTSAHQAEGSFPCASSMNCTNSISVIMDAIFVASIIICVLVRLSGILALSITLLALVLLVVLLILGLVHPPKARTHAHLF